MENNFAIVVGRVIWGIGTIGSLASGKMFEVSKVVGTYYPSIETSYNWGLVVGCLVSTFIAGALFVALGQMTEGIERNNYYLSAVAKSIEERK